MGVMVLATILALVFSVTETAVQARSVLHIKVVLAGADGKATPVAQHALLLSANPATAPPRRIVTGLGGTATVQLQPGNYTVESDQPVGFQGKSYQWTQIIDVAAGREAVLELTAGNAEVGSAADAAATTPAGRVEGDAAALMTEWQNSVVALWTPTTHASGFVIDARGLIATNQRVVGTAASVEVQLTPDVKVAATVLAADAQRDVAILWIDPKIVASVPPVRLVCAQTSSPSVLAKPSVEAGQEIFTIGVSLRQQKGVTSGTVSSVEAHAIVSDLVAETGSEGGPVFVAGGAVVGITSVAGEDDDLRRGDARIVRIDGVCDVVASAEKKMKAAVPPKGTHLPVEPARPFPEDALKNAAKHRAGSLNPYQISSSDFDIAFITPVLTYGAQYQSELASGRERSRAAGTPDAERAFVRPLMDFSNWSEYVADFPPVLLVRVTPKFVESFWMKVARGAASTQGVSLPPIKRFKPGFSSMRAFCGDAEVTPMHPFRLEQRVTEREAIYEGLYVFAHDALGPSCGSVKLVLYSEKEPEKGDPRVVEAKVLQQIWEDFAPYRDLK
jgi:S1-C subfamily serine protease